MAGLSKQQWKRLTRAIESRDLVLVLGPDASKDDQGQLDAQFQDNLKQAIPDVMVSDRYLRLEGDERDLWEEVEEFYGEKEDATSAFHLDLASIPFEHCIQISPDRLLASAFKQVGKQPIEAYYHFRTGAIHYNDDQRHTTGNTSQPLVLSLNGSGSCGDSVVLTETDLLNFLINITRDRQSLPSSLLAKLGDPKTTFLFVGFGFHRWYQRVVLHVLRGDALSNKGLLRSIALEHPARFSEIEETNSITFFDAEHALDFTGASFEEFSSELKQRLGEEMPLTSVQETTPDHDAPIVFLCYDSRDEDEVEALAAQLRTHGLNVWRDHDSLRGGEQCVIQVEHMISNVIDYFAVMHTHNFAQGESYARREVSLALARKNKFPEAWSFIIPCNFMGCEQRLDEIERHHLQYINIDQSPAKILADEILQDWQTHDRLHYKKAKPK